MSSQEYLEELEKLKYIKLEILGFIETRLRWERTATVNSGHLLYQWNSEDTSMGGVAILINKKLKNLIERLESIFNLVRYVVLRRSY